MRLARRSSVVVLAAVLFPGLALANANGIAVVGSQGCNACHSGGTTPTVTVTPSAVNVSAGGTVTLTVTVTTPNGTRAGFNLDASNGTFTNPGAGVKLLSGNATHTSPKQEDGSGLVTFTVDWVAPASGTTTFTAWGNSVNSNGASNGDRSASATTTVSVCTASTFYADADGDTFGNPAVSQSACAQPSGFVTNNLDCNDTNAQIHPNATEVCDSVDNDCDGTADMGIGNTYYRDLDGDAYGNPAVTVLACSPPNGYVADNTDCDDTQSTVHPSAPEVCDQADNNCDTNIDEGLPMQTWFVDADGDGAGGAATTTACAQPQGYVATGGDCNDNDPQVRPGLAEVCDLKDNDCDGDIDEGALLTFFADADGDTFGNPSVTQQACTAPTGFVANDDDCDDGRGDVHPGAVETCDDVDEDCDGVADNGVPLATCGLGICQRQGTTCHASSCTPGTSQLETCNGLDDDCNGNVDDDAAALCPGTDVCTAQTDGGAECAPPSEQPDAGTDADAGTGVDGGISADGGTGGDDPAGCACSSGSGGSGFTPLLALLMLAVVASFRRRALAAVRAR